MICHRRIQWHCERFLVFSNAYAADTLLLQLSCCHDDRGCNANRVLFIHEGSFVIDSSILDAIQKESVRDTY